MVWGVDRSEKQREEELRHRERPPRVCRGLVWVCLGLFEFGFGLVGLCGFAWVCMIAFLFGVLRGGSGFMLKVEGFGVRVEVFRLGLRV